MKLEHYNSKWNNANVVENRELFNTLIEYAKQDSTALHNVLLIAKENFISKYNFFFLGKILFIYINN